MFELNRILVVIEANEDRQPALERVKQLAKLADVEIELFIADFSTYLEDGYYFDPVEAQKLRRTHGEEHLQTLEKLAQPLRENGLQVSCATAWGNPPFEEIVRRVQESKPDLVIKCTRKHEKVARLVLANEDWELIRNCDAPLLLVKDSQWSEKPIFLSAVDPDHSHDKPASLDHKLIKTAQALAGKSQGEVHLYHSTRLPPLSGLYPIHGDYNTDSENVKRLAKEYSIPDEHCYLSDVEISESLPELTSLLNVSAIVMGAISRSRIDRMLIGNTAERVMDKLECDVLVIKPDKDS